MFCAVSAVKRSFVHGSLEQLSHLLFLLEYVNFLFLTTLYPIIRQLHSIKFTEFNNGTDPEVNPSKIHIFLNREVGFEDWEDVDPTQTLHLTAEDLKETADPILLKYVKFQRVRNITLFIEDNAGGDITALGGMQFFGRPVLTVNMDDFKAQKG